MAQLLEVYKCEKCGNIVEVLAAGPGGLACCGTDMELLEEQTADFTTEKHVPVVEKTDKGVKVTVGSTLHPMADDHYIQWIEIISGGKVYRKALSPGDEPVAEFCICSEVTSAREYCNVHGLWKS